MRIIAALALAAAVALAMTGGVRAGAATDRGPCALLKADEITAELDQPAGPGTNDLSPAVCQWSLFATSDRAPGTANVYVGHGKRAKKDYRRAKEFNAGSRERVDGLGRKAFYAPSTGTVFVLEDRSTLLYVQANVYSPDATRLTAGLRDALVALAKKAEARV